MDISSSNPRSGIAAFCRTGVSLLMGIFLFWLVQTGIDRRIFGLGELFSFASEGVFLPGKLIVLCVSVALCLFLGLTAFGCSLRERLNKASKKDWVLWLMSLAVVIVFFLWTLRITVLSFMTNDDTALLRTFAGIPAYGLDYASDSFAHIFFCGLMSLFYRLDPEGWWYTGYHLVAIFCSCTIIGRCILLKTRRHGWPVLAGCLVHFFLCMGAIMYPLSELSFTVTPAIVGSAAVALVLCRHETEKKAARVALDIVSIVLMMLCYLHRPEVGYVVLCFWALAVAYQAIKTILIRHPQWKKRLLSLGLCVIVVLILVFVSRAIKFSDATYDMDYWNAEYYRSMVMDYLMNDLTAEEFEAAGIPYELYTLLQNWYFMDERISTENFQNLVDLYYTTPAQQISTESSPLLSSLFRALTELIESLCSGTLRPCLTILSVLLLALSALSFIRYGRKYWLEFLCALCALGGALVISLYQVMKGRFLLRVFLVAFIPAIITILLSTLSLPETLPHSRRKSPKWLSALSILLIIGCFSLCSITTHVVPYSDTAATREDVFNTQWQVESYANEHADILFITNSTTQNLDPLHGGSYPTNIKLWGGTGVTASSNRLYDGDFFRDDIRLMFETPGYPGYVMILLQFLTLDNGPVYAVDEAHLTDTIFIFDFEQISPADDYTGWYEWNGMTYYFENGQALTGTHVIDGTEYNFAPVGSQSPMFYLETTEGNIYTTKAYSLITPET